MNNTQFRYSALTIIVGSIYLLNLTSLQVKSGPTSNAVHMKGSTRLNIPPDGTKRVSVESGGGGGGGGGKVNPNKAVAEVKSQKIGDSNKFQARMMQQDQQSSQNSYYADSWHPHSLVPTFTDQEQGDEMVALASDSYGAEQSFQPNNQSSFAEAIPISKSEHRSMGTSHKSGKPLHADESLTPRAPSSTSNAKMHSSPADEYYSDEEEDEEEQGKMMPGEYDNQPAYQEHKDVSLHNKFRQTTQNKYRSDNNQYADYTDNDGYRSPTVESSMNKTSIKTSPISNSDKSWLPTTGSNSSDNNQHFDKQLEPFQQPKSQTPTQTQAKQSQQRPHEVSERLSSLLSGRTLGKTDVAIEYLKSILESRQNLLAVGNLTSSNSSATKQLSVESYFDKNAASQQKILPQINQNREFPLKSSISNENENSKPEKSYDAKDTADTNIPLNIDKTAGKTFLSQQADAKFTINDVKPTPNLDSAIQTQSYQTSTTSSPTIQMSSKSMAQDNRQYMIYQDELSSGNIPNGTPLGGDYIDSHDDYPRAFLGSHLQHLQQRQQRQQLQMFPQESNPSPVRQLPDQRVEEALSPAPSPGNQPQHQYPAPLKKPNQSDKLKIDYNSFPVFEQRVPQQGISTSSRYFQMQQMSNKYSPQAEQKLSEAAFLGQETRKDKGPHYEEDHKILANQLEKNNLNKTDGSNNQDRVMRPDDEGKYAQHEILGQAKQNVQDYNQRNQKQQQSSISSKIYKDEVDQPQAAKQALNLNLQPSQLQQQQLPTQAKFFDTQFGMKQKPPKIVSYNYFENPSETGESELMATNYQLGDALYSSNGGIEQLLSQTELDAIQSQFMTAEHPVVPVVEHQPQQQRQHPAMYQANYQDSSLAGLLSNWKPNDQVKNLQKLNSPTKEAGENLKELASEEDHIRVMAPSRLDLPLSQSKIHDLSGKPDDVASRLASKQMEFDGKKKKSLIVYLNHPRPVDMSKVSLNSDGLSLAQSIGEQPTDTFISAKEFDSHGLSKDSKHLDVSNIRGLGDVKESQDKDGLSVVVIGDAYKYKKIVLLISSKSGGLKFIPMVKDMKK